MLNDTIKNFDLTALLGCAVLLCSIMDGSPQNKHIRMETSASSGSRASSDDDDSATSASHESGQQGKDKVCISCSWRGGTS